jgi:ferric-dicitrate binding protein FerR (iron transport regulator)
VSDEFESELAADERFERRLFWRQLAIVVLVAALIALLIVVG